MEFTTTLRNLRQGPRKVRLVADLIKGLSINDARLQLSLLNKRAAGPVLKCLNSAVANAQHNHQQSSDKLFVKNTTVDAGRTLKRWDPRAYGRAFPIRQRSAHLSIVLTDEPIKAKK